MGWFHQVKNPKLKNVKKVISNTPVGLWKKCNQCGEILQADKLEENMHVCPLCDYHYRISAYERIAVMTDENSFEEISPDLISNNPLEGAQTMTGFIANAALGDSRVGSLQYDTLFAVGLLLFTMTLIINFISIRLVRRYREAY